MTGIKIQLIRLLDSTWSYATHHIAVTK